MINSFSMIEEQLRDKLDIMQEDVGTVLDSVSSAEDLTSEEIEQIREYVDTLKKQRNVRGY